MNLKVNSGMWIRQKTSAEIQDKTWIFSVAIVIAATDLFLLTMADLTDFAELCMPWIMLLAGICTCCLLQFVEKGRKLISLAAAVIAFLFVCICGKQILGGACLFWNQAGDAWTAQTGIVLPTIEISVKHGSEDMQMILFSVIFGCAVAAGFWFVAKISQQLLAVVFPISVFALMALFQSEGKLWYLIPVLLLSVCLLLYETKRAEDGALRTVVMRWGTVLFCCGLLLVGAMEPGVVSWARDIGEQTEKKIHDNRYETAYTILPEGRISEDIEDGSQREPALAVTMEHPEQLYLRGFTGADFIENCWNPLDTKKLAEQEDLLYWLNVSNLNPHGQYAAVASLAMNDAELRGAKQTITVQNINACSQYMYVPYTLYGDSQLDARHISSDGVDGKGERTYLYQIITSDAEIFSSLSDYLKAQTDENAKAYLEAEQHYRKFVYEHYLTISDDVMTQLQPDWAKAAKGYGNVEDLTLEEAQECVLRFMEIYQSGEHADDNTFQRATVAVMTLRYFGMPSRYAEGYVITEEMADNAEEGSVQIDASHGCAWAEVYKDGVGWIPVQELPGMEDAFTPLNPDKEGENLPPNTPPEPDLSQEEQELQPDDPQTENGFVVALEKNKPLILLLFLIPVLLILAAFAIRRNMLIKRRNEKWDGEDVRDAVAWIFADTADLLKRLGYSRENGSMRSLMKPVQEQLGEGYAAEFAKMIDLNDRAIFSSKPMDEKSRETARKFYEATLQQLLENAKWHKKIWMRWILCLY